jgi:hypothetical protein
MDKDKMNTNLEVNLFNKEGFEFSRVCKNHYRLKFNMENKNIIMSQIIDFSLIKLIYDLNPDVYEKVNMEKLNDNEAIINLLMKHFFEDLGLPQRFSFIHMKKIVEERKIIFQSQSIKSHRPVDMPQDAELMAIKNMTSVCDIITPHMVLFSFDVTFDEEMNVPPFAEKMVGMISHKIFKRVKQFIENARI